MTETNPQITQIPQIDRPDATMMRQIREDWGGDIAQACEGTPVPESLLAGLVASESGGKFEAQNLETGIFQMFHEILEGGSNWLEKIVPRERVQRMTPQEIRRLSTSFGLTQVTGYHCALDPYALLDPAYNLQFAVRLLMDFANQWDLDPRRDHEQLLHCWNAGSPRGQVAVAWYIPKTLEHIRTYDLLSGGDSAASPREAAGLERPQTSPLPETEGGNHVDPPRSASPSALQSSDKWKVNSGGKDS